MAEGVVALPHPYAHPPRSDGVPTVAPRDLARLLEDPTGRPYLIDVRPPSERAAHRFPTDREVALEELPEALPTVPHDRPVVAVDRTGFRAIAAVEYLRDRGFPLAAALDGGLAAYAAAVDPTLGSFPAPAVDVRLLLRSDTGCAAYLLSDPQTREAVIVDPGRDVAPYRTLLADGGLRLRAIVETHTHADHLAGHSALHAATDAPIYLSHRSPAVYPHCHLTEGEAVNVGASELEVLETPGHTPDHLTLKLGDRIFTGDTLLLGSCGRTDLGPGSPDQLFDSLHDKILRLPAETEVRPAHVGALHGLPQRTISTVGFERVTNEALLQETRESFRKYMTEGWPPKPADFDRIVRENLED